MNIAQISQCYKPIIGGQDVYISNLMKVLEKAGHQNKVFQPNKGVEADDVVNVFQIKGLARIIKGAEGSLFNASLGLFHAKEIGKYDAIIAHYALHAWPRRKYADKTIVLSHGVEWHLENQTWHDKAREKAAKNCFDLFPHVVNDTHYLRHHGLDIKPSENCFEEVAPNKWFIPNCVDGEKFSKGTGHSSLANRKVILCPRQMVVDRGIDLAIKAFKLISEEDSELELCLLGKRRAGKYLGYLYQLIIDLELQDKVYFAQDVPNEEMPKWYNGALVTVIPTLRREGTSLSALESMSCGTACVSTNVAGLADLPTVQSDPNEESLAEALRETIRNAEKIGMEQQKKVSKVFNMENWVEAWLNVLKKVSKS